MNQVIRCRVTVTVLTVHLSWSREVARVKPEYKGTKVKYNFNQGEN